MKRHEVETLVALAESMAAEAVAIARGRFGRAAPRRKSDGSDVTDADLAIQKMMIDRISGAFPAHAIVGEESGVLNATAAEAAKAEFCWVTDPLDGTRNYTREFPVFATAIALLEWGRPVVGLVRSLTTDDTYVATRGGGTTHNGRRVTVDTEPLDLQSMIAVQSTVRDGDDRLIRSLSGTAILRNLGSTALHLALVATGALGGAVAAECKLWDVAAPGLLVEEAGGRCTDWSGRAIFPADEAAYRGSDLPFVAAGPAAHVELLNRLRAT